MYVWENLKSKGFMNQDHQKIMSASVKAIPEGHHTITPYLVVKNGAQAIEFYKKAFGAEESFRMNGPDGKSIGHAQLKIGDSVFMLADEFPHINSLSPESISGSPVSMYLYVEDVDAVFNQAVSAGATVLNPIMDMFYGDGWGCIKEFILAIFLVNCNP